MQFPLTADAAARVVVLEETPSTNDDMAILAAVEPVEEFTVVVSTNQTAGRGRLGRVWVAPPGSSLAASVLLRPDATRLRRELYGWIPLVAGLAMARAVGRLVSDREVALKWPNDVLIDGRKACGVLTELLPDGSVVVGTGVNLTLPAEALPVPNATSLLLMGVTMPAEELADVLLAGYLAELGRVWESLGAGNAADGIRKVHAAVSAVCSTLGERVRVTFPDGSALEGTAHDLDDVGRLRVRKDADGGLEAVAAGDITHLRYE